MRQLILKLFYLQILLPNIKSFSENIEGENENAALSFVHRSLYAIASHIQLKGGRSDITKHQKTIKPHFLVTIII